MAERSFTNQSVGSPSSELVSAPMAAEKQITLQMKVGLGAISFDDTGGEGPLVIAVPGMGDLRSEYRYLTPYLNAAGYRIVTVDIRGHGGSSTQWEDLSAHAMGRDLLALMAHLGQQRAILIGNSFTAGAALWAAHDAPERVMSTVLIGPVLRDPPHGIPWYIRAVLSIGLGGPWRVGFWLTYYKSLFPTRKPSDFSSYCKTLRDNLREPGRMDALKGMLSLSKADTEAMLSKTDIPALVVMGTKDADFPDPAEEAQWVSKRVGAEVLIVQGAGHYPHAEMPEEVGPSIVRFLNSHLADRNPMRNHSRDERLPGHTESVY